MQTAVASQKAWLPADLGAQNIHFEWSPEASREVAAYVRTIAQGGVIEQVSFDGKGLERFSSDVETCRDVVEDGRGFVVIRPISGLTFREQRLVSWAVTNYLGAPLSQNSEGNRLIHVYDRDRTKSIEQGARYHQTRQGGSIHTDNVNLPESWQYLVLSCVFPAMLGGESILVSGVSLHNYLAKHLPEALAILTQPFWWEYRGISDDLYQAPIITYDEWGEPCFRYLREYLLSAHAKAGQPLSEKQLWALDTLDALLESSAFQLRLNLQAGEILITYDTKILHGRTTFADYFETTTVDHSDQNGQARLRRTMDRAWVKRTSFVEKLGRQEAVTVE